MAVQEAPLLQCALIERGRGGEGEVGYAKKCSSGSYSDGCTGSPPPAIFMCIDREGKREKLVM
jgi:hypothetical protein